METYFNIRYEFNRDVVEERISQHLETGGAGYICVADGVVLNYANRNPEYFRVVEGALFSICDSSYVPLYLKWIYGIKVSQYCGSDIFYDIVTRKKYDMAFLGGSRELHMKLRENLGKIDERIANMLFMELPYREVDKFDYEGIAEKINERGADIVWVSLGAPKQEEFMSRLNPFLRRGVMIGVGAVFKFYSGTKEKRAPQWMVNHHLEFLFRIGCSPRKQIYRCWWIVRTLPGLLLGEIKRKKQTVK